MMIGQSVLDIAIENVLILKELIRFISNIDITCY